MADAPISGLPAATLPLAGTELVALVQGGVTKKAAVNGISGTQYWTQSAGTLIPTTLTNIVSVGAAATSLAVIGNPPNFQVHGNGVNPYVQLFASAVLVTDQPNTIPADVGGLILPGNANPANGGLLVLGITGKTSTSSALTYNGFLSNPTTSAPAHHFSGQISNGSGTYSSLPGTKLLATFDGNGSAGNIFMWGDGSMSFQNAARTAESILTMNSSGAGSRGFYPPRLDTGGRNAIASPGDGLSIYNITTHQPEWYDANAAAWRSVVPVSSATFQSVALATSPVLANAPMQNDAGGVIFDIPFTATGSPAAHEWVYQIAGNVFIAAVAFDDGAGNMVGPQIILSQTPDIPTSVGGQLVVGAGTPVAQLAMSVVSTTQGSRPFPAMTTAERIALAAIEGQEVYDTDLRGTYSFNGTFWIEL